ncbi:hypothetical protein [Actinoplanes sp. NPDC026670]|uniref:hypothetical protein n=1 Tax=Actinoplanes sp. NPDC026670 TaxID=3154700 RepID=UPI0033C3EE1F
MNSSIARAVLAAVVLTLVTTVGAAGPAMAGPPDDDAAAWGPALPADGLGAAGLVLLSDELAGAGLMITPDELGALDLKVSSCRYSWSDSCARPYQTYLMICDAVPWICWRSKGFRKPRHIGLIADWQVLAPVVPPLDSGNEQ